MDSAILPRLTGLQKTLPKPSSAVAILSAVKTLFFAAIQSSVLFWFSIRRSADVDTIWPNCVTIANIPHPWLNQRELSLICGIVSEWMDCRRISVTAPEDRPLFASFFESTHSHHHVCLAVVAISSIVVAAAWGCKIWMQYIFFYRECRSGPVLHNPRTILQLQCNSEGFHYVAFNCNHLGTWSM